MFGDPIKGRSIQSEASLQRCEILPCFTDGVTGLGNAAADVSMVTEHVYLRVASQVERDHPVRMPIILDTVAEWFDVPRGDVIIIGSARFGCSLRSGKAFLAGMSDLDLAIVSATAVHAWAGREGAGDFAFCDTRYHIYARRGIIRPDLLPDRDRRMRYLLWCSDLSDQHRDLFSGITVTLYATREAFLRKQANEIRRYWTRIYGTDLISRDVFPQSTVADRPSRRAVLVERASRSGFPCFLHAVEESFPFNTAPFLVRWSEFERLAKPGRRLELLFAMESLLRDLRRWIHIDCMMIGGSFIRAQCESPGDLDIIIFYRAHAIDPCPATLVLRDIIRAASRQGIDARLVPLDGPPAITVKLIAFFSILYTTSRDDPVRPGMIIVEPPPQA